MVGVPLSPLVQLTPVGTTGHEGHVNVEILHVAPSEVSAVWCESRAMTTWVRCSGRDFCVVGTCTEILVALGLNP